MDISRIIKTSLSAYHQTHKKSNDGQSDRMWQEANASPDLSSLSSGTLDISSPNISSCSSCN